MNSTPSNMPGRTIDLDELSAAIAADLETVAPSRKTRAIALRLVAMLVRRQAKGFEGVSQSQAAQMLGVSQSAISRAGDRGEEALARFRRGASHNMGSLCAQ